MRPDSQLTVCCRECGTRHHILVRWNVEYDAEGSESCICGDTIEWYAYCGRMSISGRGSWAGTNGPQ